MRAHAQLACPALGTGNRIAARRSLFTAKGGRCSLNSINLHGEHHDT